MNGEAATPKSDAKNEQGWDPPILETWSQSDVFLGILLWQPLQ